MSLAFLILDLWNCLLNSLLSIWSRRCQFVTNENSDCQSDDLEQPLTVDSVRWLTLNTDIIRKREPTSTHWKFKTKFPQSDARNLLIFVSIVQNQTGVRNSIFQRLIWPIHCFSFQGRRFQAVQEHSVEPAVQEEPDEHHIEGRANQDRCQG